MRRNLTLVTLGCACIVAAVFIYIVRSRKDTNADLPRNGAPSASAAVKGPSDTGSPDTPGPVDQLANKVVEEQVAGKVPAEISADLALKKTREKRGGTTHKLVPYSQVEASLKDQIRKEKGGISEEKIDGLVAEAAQLEEGFWAKGDFDNVSSFDDIYRARAEIELCLEADPTNEMALKQLVEVLQAGWPIIISGEEDKQLVEEGMANQVALYAPLWTLWEQQTSKKNDPSFEDFELAVEFVKTATPPDVYRAMATDYMTRNPSASKGDARKAALAAADERKAAALNWAISLCERKGAAWEVYANPLRSARDVGSSMNLSLMVVPTSFVPRQSLDDKMRYDLGRFYSFNGPKSRADKRILLHEIKLNRPVGTR